MRTKVSLSDQIPDHIATFEAQNFFEIPNLIKVFGSYLVYKIIVKQIAFYFLFVQFYFFEAT